MMKRMIKKNSLYRTAALLLAVLMLTGLCACGKRSDDPALDALKEGLKNAGEKQEAQTEADTDEKAPENGKDDEQAPDASDTGNAEGLNPEASDGYGLSDIYVAKRYDDYYSDQGDLEVEYKYETFYITDELKSAYPELANTLMVINDRIATEEGHSYRTTLSHLEMQPDAEHQRAMDAGIFPFEEEWEIYVRRADEDYVSLVTRHRQASDFDYDAYSYVGCCVDTKTGKEMELSDFVKDEDALFALVGEKAYKAVAPQGGDHVEDGNLIPAQDLAKMIRDSLRDNLSGWTLDPQGLTFWINSFTAVPWSYQVSVLFAEDTDGRIFKEECRDLIPERWVMEVPLIDTTYFDAEDDGDADQIRLYEQYEYYDEEYRTVTGLSMNFNEDSMLEDYSEYEAYDFRGTLLHFDHRTVLLEEHHEYDEHFLDLYTLKDGRTKYADTVDAYVETLPYELLSDEYTVAPRHIPADPANMQLTVYTNLLSTCESSGDFFISGEGKWVRKDPFYTILESSRYTITLKMGIGELPIVDEDTFDVMSTKTDLKQGDKLTMEYTDGESYVDCRTKDGKLVRIYVHDDEELYRSIEIDGKKYGIYDVFEDMMFAG